MFSTALDILFILLIAGGIAMVFLPAGVIALGVFGLGISYLRNSRSAK
jgi:hypothetical protein